MGAQIVFGDIYKSFLAEVCNIELFESCILILKQLTSAVNPSHNVKETSGVLSSSI